MHQHNVVSCAQPLPYMPIAQIQTAQGMIQWWFVRYESEQENRLVIIAIIFGPNGQSSCPKWTFQIIIGINFDITRTKATLFYESVNRFIPLSPAVIESTEPSVDTSNVDMCRKSYLLSNEICVDLCRSNRYMHSCVFVWIDNNPFTTVKKWLRLRDALQSWQSGEKIYI